MRFFSALLIVSVLKSMAFAAEQIETLPTFESAEKAKMVFDLNGETECRLNRQPYEPCKSPVFVSTLMGFRLSPVNDGDHTLIIRRKGESNTMNLKFRVVRPSPPILIVQPIDVSYPNAVSFQFKGSSNGAICLINEIPLTPCESDKTLTVNNLPPGRYHFKISNSVGVVTSRTFVISEGRSSTSKVNLNESAK